MADTRDFNRVHPDYKTTEDVRVKARDLYEGSDVVKSETKKATYLIQGKNEDTTDYDRRVKRAVLDPFVEKIILARQALLFSKEAKREIAPDLKAFEPDVDNQGTPSNLYFMGVAENAQIDGLHWVLVNHTRLPESGYPSAAAERDAGHRPFFESVPAASVLDWAVDTDQKLIWVIIKENSIVSRTEDQVGLDPAVTPAWTIWTRTEWIQYEQASKSATGTDSRYIETARASHNLGVVPIVPFYGTKRSEFSGWPVTRSVLDHVVQIYNKDSDLDWFEHLSSHPIPYVVSPTKMEKMDVGDGLWIQSGQGDVIQVAYLEPTGAGFSSIRASIEDLRYRILSIALAQAKKDSAQVQSQDAQREDRRMFASSLKTVSQWFEDSELQCWEIMAKWRGKADAKIEISYNRDFDDKMIQFTMVQALRGLVDNNDLTKRTLLELFKRYEILPPDLDIEKELEAVKAQEREAQLMMMNTITQQAGQETGT
ncbi:DUF4055 domain-containing protein [bacterium]|nr:DUF4055 domain-containing protein [bacterium]